MKFYIYNLGCKVNTYEAEVMKNELLNSGYLLCEKENADIFIINSCCVTNVAESKTLRIIRQVLKKEKLVIVVGCLSQIKSEEIKKMGVSIILGNKDKSKIVEYIQNYKNEPISKIYDLNNVEFENMKVSTLSKTRAFVKIQDGCCNYCSYCIIPYVRGNIRSKTKKNVLEEIKDLVKNDYKEIILTGIHTGSYGIDLGISLESLLEEIVKIKDLQRLRISSIEITEITGELLKIIKKSKIIVDHLHIPLQSGSNKILKTMKRKYNIDYFIDKITKIKTIRPNISITTDIIAGFPGETEEYFNETIDIVKRIKFSKLHVFPYSKKDKTEASNFDNQINNIIKKDRVNILLDLSKKLELKFMNKQIDKVKNVLVETIKDGYLIGHSEDYLLVKLKGNRNMINEIVSVKIEKIEYPYLMSNVVK